jgi:drug/metabolite transporter (DMT)-like permease
MLFAVFLSGAVVSFFGTFIAGHEWTWSVLVGILMGVFSFSANASMYRGFAVGKASIVAIFTGLPSIVVAFLAYMLWGETLTFWQLIALVIIVAGVLCIQYSEEMSVSNLQGLKWGLLAMLFFGFNDTMGKQAMLLEADVLPTLFCMFLTGSLLFCGNWIIMTRKDRAAAGGREEAAAASASTNTSVQRSTAIKPQAGSPWPLRKVFAWGLVVGLTNVSGMIFILPAFKLGVTGLVSAVVALNVLMILFYTRFTTKAKFRRLELVGIIFSFIGILLLRLFQ